MITINPITFIISVPQSYLTLVSGTLYTLDTETFRTDLKAFEYGVQGMVQLKTHIHNTTYTIVGTIFARAIRIIAPYSVEFEDGQYSVRLEGSNNNIWDVGGLILVQNQVQVIPTNSAGLTVPVTAQDIWQDPQASSITVLNSRNANP